MNSQAKLIVSIALFVVMIAALALALIGILQNTGMKPADATKGVVLVYEEFSDGYDTYAGTGTGWAIGKQGQPVEYIVTNGHVVQGVVEYGGNLLVYYSAAEDQKVSPNIVFYSPPEVLDIAILKLPTPTTIRSALTIRSSGEVAVGETVYALGYPAVSQDVQSYSTYDQSDITVTRGIISKRSFVVGVQYESFQTDAVINAGNSGGPLVDEHGFVVGINTLSSTVTEANNYAILADHLTRILDEERISYSVKGGSNWMIFVFLPIAVLALVGAVIILVVKPKPQPVMAAAPVEPQMMPPVVLPPAGPPIRQPILRGVSGRFAGQSFPLSGVKMTLGRDPTRCNIVYDSETPGVSGCHCSILYDMNTESFLLTDNGSSYGTFLGSGRKLTATVPERLGVGDSFYLADTANRFVVTKE